MRFSDTLDGWQEQLRLIQQNSYLLAFIRAISNEQPKIVKVEKTLNGNDIAFAMCHDVVKEHISRFGGEQVFGWMIRPWTISDNTEFDGMLMAVFHSNWLSPENELVSVTPDKSEFQIFLQDRKRRFNFSTLESYNNRTIYLDSYKPPYDGVDPVRNVNYFTSGPFSDRDKVYEKYRIPQPNERIEDLLPHSMMRVINGSPRISPEGQKYISLKYSVNIES